VACLKTESCVANSLASQTLERTFNQRFFLNHGSSELLADGETYCGSRFPLRPGTQFTCANPYVVVARVSARGKFTSGKDMHFSFKVSGSHSPWAITKLRRSSILHPLWLWGRLEGSITQSHPGLYNSHFSFQNILLAIQNFIYT